MAKRRVVIAGLLFWVSVQLLCADVSAGLSVSSGYSIAEMKASLASVGVESQSDATSLPLRAAAWVDLGYVLFSAGVSFQTLGYVTSSQTIGGATTISQPVGTGTRGYLSFSMIAELPIPVGPVTIFPLFGFQVDTCLGAVDPLGNDLWTSMTAAQRANENRVWIETGVGVAFAVSRGVFLRPWLMLGYKLLNGAENTVFMNVKTAGFEPFLLTLEPRAGISIGFGL